MQTVECDGKQMSSVGRSLGQVVNGAALALRQPRLLAVGEESTDHDTACECVCVSLGGSFFGEAATLIGAHDGLLRRANALSVRVVLGSPFEPAPACRTAARLRLLDIDIAPFADLELPASSSCWTLAPLASGSVRVHGMLLEQLCAVAFQGDEPVARLTGHTGASVLWLEAPYALTPARTEGSTRGRETAVGSP